MSQFEVDFPRHCSKSKKKKKVCGFILRSPLWICVVCVSPDALKNSRRLRRVGTAYNHLLVSLFLHGILKIASVGKGLPLSCLPGREHRGRGWWAERKRREAGRGDGALGSWQVNPPLPGLAPSWESGGGLVGVSPLMSTFLTVIWAFPSFKRE